MRGELRSRIQNEILPRPRYGGASSISIGVTEELFAPACGTECYEVLGWADLIVADDVSAHSETVRNGTYRDGLSIFSHYTYYF